MKELENMLQTVTLTDREDSWCWEGDPSGGFSVRSLRLIIDNISNTPFAGLNFWNSGSPRPGQLFRLEITSQKNPDLVKISFEGNKHPFQALSHMYQ